MSFFLHPYFLILFVFIIGYIAIIMEYPLKINKTAVSLLIAVVCWAIYFSRSHFPLKQDLKFLGENVSEISQIIFFLIGAMTLVELIDSHQGFKLITDLIHTKTRVRALWVIAIFSFFLSSVLDNLTTTILMVSILRKLIPHKKDRFVFACMVVVSANAGGAWTPIGDVTTTMLWINGQISSIAVMKALFIPSVIAMLIPLCIYSFQMRGSKYPPLPETGRVHVKQEYGAKVVLVMGLGGLIFVPLFKAWTGLPPFMGILISLAILWLVTDYLHIDAEQRKHLRVPQVLTRIDTSGILFFLGILLAIGALDTAGILYDLATWLNTEVKSLPAIATLLGIFSAIIDNVPLVAASQGMYQFPLDDAFWHMIAYAAGTGGSIFIIGSSAGVALMGLEKIDFVGYMKKASIPVFIGYLLGMAVYIYLSYNAPIMR
jgi:Na+/H+ antiporter NhaD/arsenite permease-like protein